MHTEIIAIDIGSNRHIFKTFDEKLINSLVIIFSQNLLPEGETLGHVPRLVVASKDYACFLEVELYAAEQEDGFHAVDSPVNVVAQEEVAFAVRAKHTYFISAGSPAFSSMCTKS